MRYVVLALAALGFLAVAVSPAAPADAPPSEPARGPGQAPVSSPRAAPASAGLSVDCGSPPQVSFLDPPRPHPPIRVIGNDPKQGFTVSTASQAADRPVYRPGSGVVSGDGTEADPYVIGGWATTGILLENTSAHVRVQQNALLYPQNWPTGSTPDPFPLFVYEGRPVVQVRNASNVTVADNLVDRRYRDQNVVDAAMLLRDSIGVTASHDVAVVDNRIRRADRPLERPGTWPVHLHVQDSRDVCLKGNDVDARPEAHQGGIRVTGSQDVRIEDHDVAPLSVRVVDSHRTRLVDNTLGETTLRESPHAILRENRWPAPSTLPGRDYVNHDPALLILGEDPGAWNHTIPPSNLVEGQPLAYVGDEDNDPVEEPVGQVIVGGAANATVRDVHLTTPLLARHARNVTVANATFTHIQARLDMVAPAAIWARNVSDLEVRESLVEGVIPQESRVDGAIIDVVGSQGVRLVNTTMERPHSSVNVKESDGVVLDGMRFRDISSQCAMFTATHNLTVKQTRCSVGFWGFLFYEGSPAEPLRNVTFRNSTIIGKDGPETRSFDGIDSGKARMSNLTVVDNNFTHLENGVTIASPAEVHGNNFRNVGEGLDDWSEGSGPTDGRWNWWGCPDGPGDGEDCATVDGDVVFDPWLTEPNPEAGAG